MLRNDYRRVLGESPSEFWKNLNHPCAADARCNVQDIAVMLYGDEGTFLNETWMCLHWQPEHSRLSSDSRASRFLITCLKKSMYHIENEVNLTLQTAMRIIAEAFQRLSAGIACSSSLVRMWVTAVKGDWKFLAQMLNLRRHYNALSFCWQCDATKSMGPFVWTDLAATAGWRRTLFQTLPWNTEPSVVSCPGFQLEFVMSDLLHCWYLGVQRDIISACMAILIHTRFFLGCTIADRLHRASTLLHEWCKRKGKVLPSRFAFKKANLGFQTKKNVIIFQWLVDIASGGHALDNRLGTLLYVADRLFQYMVALKREGCSVLTQQQGAQIEAMGEALAKLYLSLHLSLKGTTRYKLLNPRPKVHQLLHTFIQARRTLRLPLNYWCWMDEDWVRHQMNVAKKCHPKQAPQRLIERVLLSLKSRLTKALAELDKKDLRSG